MLAYNLEPTTFTILYLKLLLRGFLVRHNRINPKKNICITAILLLGQLACCGFLTAFSRLPGLLQGLKRFFATYSQDHEY